MNFQENFSLKKHNTFGITAKAKFFVAFHSVEELATIISSTIFKQNRCIVLGGGSNVLFTQDFDGLVLHNKISGIVQQKETADSVFISVGAGVVWHDLVMWSVNRNLSGIENLALIPGTVGASPIQNIGAYGVEAKDAILTVTAMEISTQKIIVFTNTDCHFGYRDSVFKGKLKNQFIITKVDFRLSKLPLNKTSYGSIQEELEQNNQEANPQNIAKAVISIRKRKLPDPAELGNSGSFFKNPIIPTEHFNLLQQNYPEIIGYKMDERSTKIACGWLIENAGLKGWKQGNVGVHQKQALVLVNYGNATGKEVLQLAKYIQEIVFEKYQISIEPEVNIL